MIQNAHFHSICDNLLAHACITKATEIKVELREEPHCIDLVVRDNGSGMTSEQLQSLVSDVPGKSGLGYGRGLHNISQLASNMGAMVQPFKSMHQSGTEVIVSFMKAAGSSSGRWEHSLALDCEALDGNFHAWCLLGMKGAESRRKREA